MSGSVGWPTLTDEEFQRQQVTLWLFSHITSAARKMLRTNTSFRMHPYDVKLLLKGTGAHDGAVLQLFGRTVVPDDTVPVGAVR